MSLKITQNLLKVGDRLSQLSHQLTTPPTPTQLSGAMQSLLVDPLSRFSEQINPLLPLEPTGVTPEPDPEWQSSNANPAGTIQPIAPPPKFNIGAAPLQKYPTTNSFPAPPSSRNNGSPSIPFNVPDSGSYPVPVPQVESTPEHRLNAAISQTVQAMASLNLLPQARGTAKETFGAAQKQEQRSDRETSSIENRPTLHSSQVAWSAPLNHSTFSSGSHAEIVDLPSQSSSPIAVSDITSSDFSPVTAAPQSSPGIRMANGRSRLTTLLQSNLTHTSAPISNPPPANSPSVSPPVSNSPSANSSPVSPPVSASFPTAASSPAPPPVVPPDPSPPSTVATPQPPPIDLDLILDQLEDRLEFEFLRTYGTSGR